MGGGIESKLNNIRSPVIAVTVANPKDDVNFIPYSFQAPAYKKEEAFPGENLSPEGEFIKFAKLNITKTTTNNSIGKTFFEDFSSSQAYPPSVFNADFSRIKEALEPKWKKLSQSVEKHFDDPKFGTRADILPKKNMYVSGGKGGLKFGNSVDNEAMWCTLQKSTIFWAPIQQLNVNGKVKATDLEKRIHERIKLNPSSTQLLGDTGVKIEHVQQGILHTDWIFAPVMAMIGLGKSPQSQQKQAHLQNLFFDDKIGKNIIGVGMFVKGKWEVVRLDGKLPMWKRLKQEDWVYKNPKTKPKSGGCCSKQEKSQDFTKLKMKFNPVLHQKLSSNGVKYLRKLDSKKSLIDFVGAQMASPTERVTWPLYLEKAFAKVFNGYYNINIINNPVLAFKSLTGAPTSVIETINFEDDYELWDHIVESIGDGDIICFRCCDYKQAQRVFSQEYELFVADKVKKTDQQNKKNGHPDVLPQGYHFMLEVLGFVSNGIYPVLDLNNAGGQSSIVTKSPANLGKGLSRTMKLPLFSYAKETKKFTDGTFKVPISNLKSLVSTLYINHFRPDNSVSSVNAHFKPQTISSFSLKFETQGEYSVQVFCKQECKVHLSVLSTEDNSWLGGKVGVSNVWCEFELGGTVETRNEKEAQVFVSYLFRRSSNLNSVDQD